MAVSGGSPSFTTITTTSDATLNGLTVGKGGNAQGSNVALGVSAGAGTNTGAGALTAVGYQALTVNSTGGYNTANGFQTLLANTTGSSNTAIGASALQANTTASSSVAVGYQAGYTQTTGGQNTYIGYQAGLLGTLGPNTYIGYKSGSAMTSGYYNTILGGFTGVDAGFSLDIRTGTYWIMLSDSLGTPRMWYEGDNGVWAAPQIYNSSTALGANVYVGTTGRLYRATSSLKYKNNVQTATFGLADVLKLRAVTYEGIGLDDGNKTYAGLIAEEVHEAGLTEFVQYASDGTPDALSYGNMVSLCVKAIQELKAELDTVKAELAALKG
jgi:hypothetical protein